MTYSKEIKELSESLKRTFGYIPRKLRIVLKDYTDASISVANYPCFYEVGFFPKFGNHRCWTSICKSWLQFVALSEADQEAYEGGKVI